MDLVLSQLDDILLNDIYKYTTLTDPNNIIRQCISVFLFTWLSIYMIYMISGTILYHYTFDKKHIKDPRYLPNQMWQEIWVSTYSLFFVTLWTTPIIVAEVNGYSKLHLNEIKSISDLIDTLGYFVLYFMLSDLSLYILHRISHQRLIYPYLHKVHHKFLISTPFAGPAFHPIDAWGQALPYQFWVFILPINKILFLIYLSSMGLWAVILHDQFHYLDKQMIINGTLHHTIHHRRPNNNYGQHLCIWDRMFGTHTMKLK